MIGGNSVYLWEESGLARDRRLMTIDMLPDDVLLEIIDFYEYVDDLQWYTRRNTWHELVHVSRRWRYLVFASPRRLKLRLVYQGHRPMSEALGAWPVLPVSLISITGQSDGQRDNMVAALESEHSNRICEICMYVTDSHWERFAAAMEKPFPELTHLEVLTLEEVRVLPDSFLSGSAPHLRTLVLERIPFPSIPKLLLLAHCLVTLSLVVIPDSGYFSPDAMATALTVMTRLKSLDLVFLSPRSRPDPESRPLPPLTRFVLPALTRLEFKGVYEYLEDLIARIDIPLLHYLIIQFFMDLDFDIPQLHQLIGHAKEFKAFNSAEVSISDHVIRLELHPISQAADRVRWLVLEINCRELDYQLSSLAQVCSSSFPLISTVEELRIREDNSLSSSHCSKDDMENSQWLDLLGPFTALEDLYLTHGIAQHVCSSLQELPGGRVTEPLPTLRNLFVDGFSSLAPVQESMKSFVTARQLSGHPVVVDHWRD